MDFGKLDLAGNADKGADCHIDHPVTGEPLYTPENKPITIRVLGQDSRVFRSALSALAARGNKGKASLEKAEAEAIDLLTKMVVSWNGIEWEGKPLDCTPDNVRMLLTALPPVRKQIDEFVADRANFFRSAGKR